MRKTQTPPKSGKPMGKPKMNFSVLGRLVKLLFGYYPVLVPVTAICILFSAVVSSLPPIFMQNVIIPGSISAPSQTTHRSLRENQF